MPALTVMAVASVGGMVAGIMGGAAAGRSERAAIAQKEYNMRAAASIREEGLAYKNLQIDANYMQNFIQRLSGYNQVRNTQLVAVGYQGRTTDSLQGVQAAGDLNFEFDNKIAGLNRDQMKINIDLNNTYANLQMGRDLESASMAKSASKSAQGWGAFSSVMGGVQGVASAQSKYSTNYKSEHGASSSPGFFGMGSDS